MSIILYFLLKRHRKDKFLFRNTQGNRGKVSVLAANSSIQLIYREYQIPILSPNDIAELYLELLEFVFIQVRVILRMWMFPDKSTHVYCLNGTITKVQFNL